MPPPDCGTVTHQARIQCKGKKGDEYDACCLTLGLKTRSDDVSNEVVCKTDGNTKVYYLNVEGGNGQVQHVKGMHVRAGPFRMTT